MISTFRLPNYGGEQWDGNRRAHKTGQLCRYWGSQVTRRNPVFCMSSTPPPLPFNFDSLKKKSGWFITAYCSTYCSTVCSHKSKLRELQWLFKTPRSHI